MLNSLVFLIFMLLPAGWLLRDWKFSDKRTNKYRYTTKTLLALWLIFGALSTFYYWDQNNENKNLQNKVNELIRGKDELLKKISGLTTQIGKYQNEIETKDKRLENLEKQARVVRSIEGNIECLITAIWSKGGHPGDLVPVSWNKAQFYVRIFENDPNDTSAILFSLNTVKMEKLSESDLKVTLEIEAKPGSGPIGQELDVLKKYGHLMVFVPFIHKGDTIDGRITIKKILATLIVNGEKKANIEHSDNLEIPLITSNKMPVFQLNKDNLFQSIYEQ